MELTNCQKEALQILISWYNSKTSYTFTLYGAAGTGKSTLINEFLKYIKHSVCVTAPTHKAVRVIEAITKRTGKTLQSLHGLRPNFNLDSFDIDKIKFERLGIIYIKNYKLVIVDEGSQVGDSLHRYNMIASNRYKTKVLYVGDRLQLPPIKQKGGESSVFELQDQYELKEIVRQDKDNPLLKPLSILRTDIQNGTSKFLQFIKAERVNINSDGLGYLCVNESDFKQLLYSNFTSPEFKFSVDHCRYCAWTNNSVLKWNENIREMIYPNVSELLVSGDIITGYKTIIDEFNNPTIINSEDYIVISTKARISDDKFSVYQTKLKSLYSKNEIFIHVVDHRDDNSLKIFYNNISKLHSKAMNAKLIERSSKWKTYYTYKDRFLLIKGFPLYSDFQTAKVRAHVVKDIDYGYGLTIHKLQGSTIKNIFVDLVDICYVNGNRNLLISDTIPAKYVKDHIIFRNKLLYTAISRAKEKAIILI
jgi:GTPase SAR1 family protein